MIKHKKSLLDKPIKQALSLGSNKKVARITQATLNNYLKRVLLQKIRLNLNII